MIVAIRNRNPNLAEQRQRAFRMRVALGCELFFGACRIVVAQERKAKFGTETWRLRPGIEQTFVERRSFAKSRLFLKRLGIQRAGKGRLLVLLRDDPRVFLNQVKMSDAQSKPCRSKLRRQAGCAIQLLNSGGKPAG